MHCSSSSKFAQNNGRSPLGGLARSHERHSRALRQFRHFLSSLSVGAALFKPNELPSVDIEPLNHIYHAVRLAFDVTVHRPIHRVLPLGGAHICMQISPIMLLTSWA